MSQLQTFNRLRYRWYFEVFIELSAMIGFFATFFTKGDIRNLIFYAVIFFWSKDDAKETYKEMINL